MKKITLDDMIKEQLKDKDFAEHYQREMLINAIAKMVVELREHTKMTQSELAKQAGTTQPVIARIESGSDMRVPSIELLARIASASNAKLKISFEEIH